MRFYFNFFIFDVFTNKLTPKLIHINTIVFYSLQKMDISTKPPSTMTADERLNLNKLIREMDTVDNTEYIRKARQSGKIAKDIAVMERLKSECAAWRLDDATRFVELCQSSCRFLFDNYTDIFGKLVKDEIDMDIMKQFLVYLSLIEEGQVDQHEGSVMVGKLLRDIYLDSAIRRGDNLDKENEAKKKEGVSGGDDDGEKGAPVEPRNVTWTEYKFYNGTKFQI